MERSTISPWATPRLNQRTCRRVRNPPNLRMPAPTNQQRNLLCLKTQMRSREQMKRPPLRTQPKRRMYWQMTGRLQRLRSRLGSLGNQMGFCLRLSRQFLHDPSGLKCIEMYQIQPFQVVRLMDFQVAQTDCQRPPEAASHGSQTDLASGALVSEIHVIPSMAVWRDLTILCEIGSMTGMPRALIPEAMIARWREARTMSEIV